LGQAWFRDLLDGVKSGVVVFDLEDPSDDTSLRLVHANPAAVALSQQDLRGFVGKRATEAFPNTSPERFRIYA
jgi:PAS domain-containing protein